MGYRLHTALLWLLLLALPFQGFAAASKFNCGPKPHSMVAGVMAASATPQVSGMSGHHQHMASTGHRYSPAAAQGAGQNKPAPQQLDKFSKGNCSACAACCMGVALPPAALVMASCLPAMVTAEYCPAPHLDYLSDGLDRPPRSTLV